MYLPRNCPTRNWPWFGIQNPASVKNNGWLCEKKLQTLFWCYDFMKVPLKIVSPLPTWTNIHIALWFGPLASILNECSLINNCNTCFKTLLYHSTVIKKKKFIMSFLIRCVRTIAVALVPQKFRNEIIFSNIFLFHKCLFL